MQASPDTTRQLPPKRDKRTAMLLGFLLMAATLLTYGPVRYHEFVHYDDQDYVTQNAEVRSGLTWHGAAWAFRTAHASNWHPVTWLSHMVDVQLFGLAPAGHHLVNVFLHSANALLLFLLFRRLTGKTWRSAVVGALFALHPLHVESVAWVAERKDLLSAFFGLLALHAYAGYARPDGTRSRKRFWYALALALFALGLMSKPMLVTLPCLMLLLDFWPLNRLHCTGEQTLPRRAVALVVEKVPFIALSVLSSLVTLAVQQPAMTFYHGLPFGSRVTNALVSYARYLGKTFWPEDLAVFYPHPGTWPAWAVGGAGALVLAISVVAVLGAKARPWFAVGWFWFIGLLVPVLGLVQVGVQSMADRYMYLPLAGLALLVTWSAAEALDFITRRYFADSTYGGARRRLRAAFRRGVIERGFGDAVEGVPTMLLGSGSAVLVVAACAVLTRTQLKTWRNTETLFTHAVAVTSDNWVAHYNLASLALRQYQDTLRSSLENQVAAGAPFSNGSQTAAREYLDRVIAHCEATLRVYPRYSEPQVTLAKALTEQGNLESARSHLETAVQLDPKNADARQNLGEIYHRQKRVSEAVREYRAALGLKPDWPELLNNTAWLLATCPDANVRQGADAVQMACRASELTGHTNLWFAHTLAAAYAEAGDFKLATQEAQNALALAQATGRQDWIQKAHERLGLYRKMIPLRAP